MKNNELRQAFDLLIDYYTASVDTNTKIFSSDDFETKILINEKLENNRKVLRTLKEDYKIIFWGEEE